jgi:hypothetical protein
MMPKMAFLRVSVCALFAAALACAQSVADFGAFPDDGKTDATPGIQAAIDASTGGRVRLPGDRGGTGAVVRANVAGGVITGFTVVRPGSGYCKAPRLEITPGPATALARVDAECHVIGVEARNPGADYNEPPRVTVVAEPRCYRVSQIQLHSGMVLEGDGHATCIVPDGSNQPVIASEGAYGFRIRDLVVRGDGKTDVGLRFRGGPGDAALCTLDGIEVSGFRQSNIELDRSYGFVLLNVHSHSSGGWGLYLRDGYNNATQVISGEYSGNAIGGVFIGTDSIQFHFTSIAESNGKYGIYYHGHLRGLYINDAYFEANGKNGEGADVRGDFLNYDEPAMGVSIRNTLFNSQNAQAAAWIENSVDVEFAHNTGVPHMIGEPFTANRVVFGRGVVNPKIDGNTALQFVTTSEMPVNSVGRAWMPAGDAWKRENAQGDCGQKGGPLCVVLARASGAANISALSLPLTLRGSGHLVGAGAWVRTNLGDGTAWLEIFDENSAYTGSTTNQPLRQHIGTEWVWIANTAVALGSKPGVRLRFYANDGSNTQRVYVRGAAAWTDAASARNAP